MNTDFPIKADINPTESTLAQGNRALRDGNYTLAIFNYLQSLQTTPALSKTIVGNLALARQKYRTAREADDKQHVAVCGWELAHNAAGRVYTLAKLYETFADVEIIGSIFPSYGEKIWEPIRNTTIACHTFTVEDESRFIDQAIALVAANPYDIVHLSKPRAPNIFFGILYKLIWDAKVIVDIDDEELAFVDEETPIGVEDYLKTHGKLPELKDLAGKNWTRIAVGLVKEFDGITVSNPALQQRYGGEIIRHARDEKLFKPSPELKRKSRGKFGIPHDKKVILFFGTPREHKGLIETAEAIAALNRKDVLFVIVGDFSDPKLKLELQAKKNVELIFIGNQPFENIPDIVAIGDVCVLLQNTDSPVSKFQVPAKLSDALGMGLVVIGQDLPQLADVRGGGAVLCATTETLVNVLQQTIADNEEAVSRARYAACKVFSDSLSFMNVAPKLKALVDLVKASGDKIDFGRFFLVYDYLVIFRPLIIDQEKFLLGSESRVSDVTYDSNTINSIEFFQSSKKSCMIRLENVNLKLATGWALCLEDKNDRVFLKVELNNRPLHIIDTHKLRNDVKIAHGGDGYVGYHAEMTEYLDFSDQAEISVAPVSHALSEMENIKSIKKKFPSLLKGQHFFDVNLKAKLLSERYFFDLEKEQNNNEQGFFASIIILNFNGLNVLTRCLQSIYKKTLGNFEIIVVDHGSTDGSIEFLKSAKYRNIKCIFRGKNYSFSSSNNLAAREAKGDILIFMNNDMIVVDDAVSAIARTVANSSFGLVGIKLWDMPQWLPVEISTSLNVVQHVGVHFRDTHRENIIDAYETRPGTFWSPKADVFETPAVTAAMMAIKTSEFFDVGGFDEAYFYGQEDVDFCLKYMKANLRKTGVLLSHGAYHARGLSRRILSNKSSAYLQNNRVVLQEKLGGWFRKKFREDQLDKSGYWNPKPYSFAMIVSDIGFETERADYFTARELGDAIDEDTDAVVGYFSTAEKEIDVSGYDSVIVFIDGFDPTRLVNVGPSTLLIAWARNWFDRWCERPWIHMYNLIFASSEFSRKYMEDTLQRKVGLLRIAASRSCVAGVKKSQKYESDYCFTGSYFNSPREIASLLDPSGIPYIFRLFGYNWENHPHFGKYTKGPVSYTDIPSVYASTKLVVDDANIATQKWGAVNCRVYDALAAGTMCITNNIIGSDEIFGSEFPTYADKISLNLNIRELLGNDAKRERLAKKFKEIVLEEHTYSHRVIKLFDSIRKENKKNRIAIKIAAPSLEKSKPWGDLYFAIALRGHLERAGYQARIDCMDQWYSARALGDDVVIVLRGLDRYKPHKNQLNILWIISHPDLVCEAEFRDYDKVYVASEHYTTQLINFTGTDNIEFLPQATDFSVEQLDPEKLERTPKHEILFIGNSRGQYREVVRWCVEEQLPITVYGQGWEEFIPGDIIAADHIDNKDIPYFYNSAKVVLNDHWPEMRRLGFISNRIWDVLGSGGLVLSDFVVGIDSIRSNKLLTFSTRNEFMSKLHLALLSTSDVVGLATTNGITPSFASRTENISAYIESNLSVCKSELAHALC